MHFTIQENMILFFIFFILTTAYSYIFYTQQKRLKKLLFHNFDIVIVTKSAESRYARRNPPCALSLQTPVRPDNHLEIR